VKLQRYGSAAGIALLAAAALSACGTNNNTTSSSTPAASGSGGSSTTAPACPSGTLNLAGSTAQTNAITQWTKDYQTQCTGVTINYNANGSGAGFTSFADKQADVAGSDYALSSTQQPQADARCGTGNTAIDIPLVPGAIAVVFNVPGVTTLNLSAKNLAAIYDGTITKWNDPAIAADNAGVTLPNLTIQLFARSDGSGTSYNFSNYLHSLVPAFPAANKQFPGTAKDIQGEKGSSAVAAKVKSTAGGIGYVEYSYATEDSLSYAKVSNAQGTFVPLTQANAANFISQAQVVQNGSDTRLAFNYSYANADAYPAVLITYEFVCATGNSSSALPLIQGFLGYAASNTAQSELTGLGYVPLPTTIASDDATVIAALK
jgi:phosphate transport system substrate-binding protein